MPKRNREATDSNAAEVGDEHDGTVSSFEFLPETINDNEQVDFFCRDDVSIDLL